MSESDDGADIGALLESDRSGPPPEIDARVRAYARERTVPPDAGEDGRSVRAFGMSSTWRRALPAVAVVALAVTLVPLVREDTSPESSVRAIGTEDAVAIERSRAEPMPAPASAPDVAVDAAADAATDADDAAADAEIAQEAPAGRRTLPTAERAESFDAPPETIVRSSPSAAAIAAEAGPGAAPDPDAARASARAVLALLREGADGPRVARALRAWRERWPEAAFGALADADADELDALRALAPEALAP